MSAMREALASYVDQVARIGCTELAQKFVLEHGKDFAANALADRYSRGRAKMCFMNAAHLALRHEHLSYVEGYGMTPALMGLPVHHAWCVDKSTGEVVDNTWDRPEECLYRGVEFDRRTLCSELVKNGVYGLFTTSVYVNHELIFARAPELRVWAQEVRGNREFFK